VSPAARDPFDLESALMPLVARRPLGVAAPPPAADRSEPLGTLSVEPLGRHPTPETPGPRPTPAGAFPYRLPPESAGAELAFTRPVRYAPVPPPPAPAQRAAPSTPVRVQAGPAASEAAAALGAAAFTLGTEVFLGDAAQDGAEERRRALLAHELTHARQALTGGPGPGAPEGEQEARGAEALVLARASGQRVPHLLVDHFVRNYTATGGGPLTALERARLDRISLRALEKSEALLAAAPGAAAYRVVDEVRVSLKLDLSGLTDDQASDQWAASIAAAIREQARAE